MIRIESQQQQQQQQQGQGYPVASQRSNHVILIIAHDRNACRTTRVVILDAAMMVAEIVAGTILNLMAVLTNGLQIDPMSPPLESQLALVCSRDAT